MAPMTLEHGTALRSRSLTRTPKISSSAIPARSTARTAAIRQSQWPNAWQSTGRVRWENDAELFPHFLVYTVLQAMHAVWRAIHATITVLRLLIAGKSYLCR